MHIAVDGIVNANLTEFGYWRVKQCDQAGARSRTASYGKEEARSRFKDKMPNGKEK